MRQLAGILLTVGLSTVSVAVQLPPPIPTGTAVLKGTVVSAETGKPLRRAQVRAVGTDPRGGRYPEVLERLRPLGSSVTIRDGQPVNVTLTMKPGGV